MSLESAYRSAVYEAALPQGPHRIVVDARDPVLDRLLVAHGVAAAARLTAANPASVDQRPEAENAAANARLAAALGDLPRFSCRSESPTGDWPEEGFLVLGLTKTRADTLACEHGQAGYLWIETGQPVTLVML